MSTTYPFHFTLPSSRRTSAGGRTGPGADSGVYRSRTSVPRHFVGSASLLRSIGSPGTHIRVTRICPLCLPPNCVSSDIAGVLSNFLTRFYTGVPNKVTPHPSVCLGRCCPVLLPERHTSLHTLRLNLKPRDTPFSKCVQRWDVPCGKPVTGSPNIICTPSSVTSRLRESRLWCGPCNEGPGGK